MNREGVAEASEDLEQAIAVIDERFGDGYAKQHPDLLAAFLISASRYETHFSAGLVEELSGAMHNLADSLSSYSDSAG